MDQITRSERNEERDFANEKLDWFILENRIRKVIQVFLFYTFGTSSAPLF